MKVTLEQTPITGKRFDILVHSANKLLDPNYASWITSKRRFISLSYLLHKTQKMQYHAWNGLVLRKMLT